ncbi:unnamed protein product [Polarella glacialis]|uniref:Uncharacterized protein n=1 Tax=Polarella glacialis TaxID=89957 RepID=A0A813H5J6_POLGL|nr:unnamed protein product [Polarella glacialis]
MFSGVLVFHVAIFLRENPPSSLHQRLKQHLAASCLSVSSLRPLFFCKRRAVGNESATFANALMKEKLDASQIETICKTIAALCTALGATGVTIIFTSLSGQKLWMTTYHTTSFACKVAAKQNHYANLYGLQHYKQG